METSAKVFENHKIIHVSQLKNTFFKNNWKICINIFENVDRRHADDRQVFAAIKSTSGLFAVVPIFVYFPNFWDENYFLSR